jgi:hypothetical protein
MKISEIKQFPIRVRLNQNFTLEESFDIGTILRLNNCVLEVDGEYRCYKVSVTALKEDMEHNRAISIPDWRNPDGSGYNLTFFEANIGMINSDGNVNDTIYVMEDDDCFDLVDDDKTLRYSNEDMLMVIESIAPTFKLINKNNIQVFIEELRFSNK